MLAPRPSASFLSPVLLSNPFRLFQVRPGFPTGVRRAIALLAGNTLLSRFRFEFPYRAGCPAPRSSRVLSFL